MYIDPALDSDLGVAVSSLYSNPVLCPSPRHINLCLVLDPRPAFVQPRKSYPNITEKLLTGSGTKRIKSSKNKNRVGEVACFQSIATMFFPRHQVHVYFGALIHC